MVRTCRFITRFLLATYLVTFSSSSIYRRIIYVFADFIIVHFIFGQIDDTVPYTSRAAV
jgi:hypothetical protein